MARSPAKQAWEFEQFQNSLHNFSTIWLFVEREKTVCNKRVSTVFFSTFDKRKTCQRKPARELLVQMRLINK